MGFSERAIRRGASDAVGKVGVMKILKAKIFRLELLLSNRGICNLIF